MDPEATLKLMEDKRLTLTERAEAALNLLVWLSMGGRTPVDGRGYNLTRRMVVDQCNTILCEALDDIDADPVEAVLDQIRAGS